MNKYYSILVQNTLEINYIRKYFSTQKFTNKLLMNRFKTNTCVKAIICVFKILTGVAMKLGALRL